MTGKPSPTSVSTKLERIAEIAKQMPGVALTSLSHHIDIDWLREAYRRTRKDGAVGVDEQTAADYAANLEQNLQSLLDRAKSGDHYRAPPVRRVHQSSQRHTARGVICGVSWLASDSIRL
jgi:RNA-directed DNA polymerase